MISWDSEAFIKARSYFGAWTTLDVPSRDNARPAEADAWATKVIRIGIACTLPFQLTHTTLIWLRFSSFAHSVMPILIADLALTLLVLGWTWGDSFTQNWREALFAWACALVLSACSVSLITNQTTALYVALVMMLFGTAAFAPWGARWQSGFIGVTLASAVGAGLLDRRLDPFEPYRLMELATAAGISLFIATLTEHYRRATATRLQELEANEEKLWRILDANPDAMSVARLSDAKYLSVSAEFLRSGYSRTELLGVSDEELKIWVDDQRRREYWGIIRTRGHVRNLEAEFRLKTGLVVHCQISGVVVDLGRGPCVISVLRNIEKLKAAERAIIAAREAAEAASQSKSEFLSNMSHEIRTPMNAILGMAEVLADSPLTVEQRKYLNVMMNNGTALLDLINDILDFARVESGRMKLESTNFEIGELAERVAETFAIRAHQKQVELIVEIDATTPPWLIGDPLRLRQILVNLVGNAIKFTDKGEIKIEIRPEDENGNLHFIVSDTGIGIPPEQRERIFASYTQADSSTARKYGGTGLGLAIVKQLTELMGGRIWVEGAPGCGSSFHFTAQFELPAGDDDAIVTPVAKIKDLRVLVVDDRETTRRVIVNILVRHGAIADCAADCDSAVGRIHRGECYDAIIIDSRMPGIDGYETIQRLGAAGADVTRMIPMLNANDLNVWLPRLKTLGMVRHLIKPIRRTELYNAIEIAAKGLPLEKGESTGMRSPAKASADSAQPLDLHEETAPVERSLRVLVADDSSDNRLLIDLFLKKAGYSLDEAENGKVAVEKFTQSRYDVVLMDIQMPVMDGYAAAREIREWESQQGLPRTPIIALTASVLDEAVGRSFEAGCDTHVSKPVRRNTLITSINEVVAAKSTAEGTATATAKPVGRRGKRFSTPDAVTIAKTTRGPNSVLPR